MGEVRTLRCFFKILLSILWVNAVGLERYHLGIVQF